jgi:hypothetical protein
MAYLKNTSAPPELLQPSGPNAPERSRDFDFRPFLDAHRERMERRPGLSMVQIKRNGWFRGQQVT